MSRRHITIYKYGTLVWHNISFYCTLKNDIVLGASASCNIIFQSAIRIDIVLTQVLYLYIVILVPDQYHTKNHSYIWNIFFPSIPR